MLLKLAQNENTGKYCRTLAPVRQKRMQSELVNELLCSFSFCLKTGSRMIFVLVGQIEALPGTPCSRIDGISPPSLAAAYFIFVVVEAFQEEMNVLHPKYS